MNRIAKGCAIAAVIGIGLGYFGAYIQFANERDHGSSYSEWKHEWAAIAALPGKIIASRLRGYDYRLTEAWSLDKHRIAALNGIVFLPLGLFVLLGKK
jgi:hypothetical protein